MVKKLVIIMFLCLTAIVTRTEAAVTTDDSLVIRRIMTYKQSVDGEADGVHTNIYVRYMFKTVKRNFTLMAIPSMYAISKGKRVYAGETFSNISIRNNTVADAVRLLDVGTIPHHRNTMKTMLKYLTPNLYDVTMLDNRILSPFNRHNASLYRYKTTMLTAGRAEVVFKPRRYNTQLISGSAIADAETGRIMKVKFYGEYDMIRFNVTAEMGKEGVYSLLPKTCDINSQFYFIGNRINATYHAVYDLPSAPPDSLRGSHDMAMMDSVRPEPLPQEFSEEYSRYRMERETRSKDTLNVSTGTWTKAMWDILGDHVINRTRGNFGNKSQGSFRISPILNPLYLGYSKRKGVVYKLKLNGSYLFSPNHELSAAFKAGYSFKQRQLYFSVPVRFTLNKKYNVYLEAELGNGNRITNSNIVEQVKHEKLDSIKWDEMNLEYFKDFYYTLKGNVDISEKWSLQPGMVFHRRTAVDRTGFDLASRPVSYYSFAPSIQVQFRPYGMTGPVITSDYERGIHLGMADMQYERLEFDFSWKHQFYSLRSLSLRAGSGFYTSKSKKAYFLDYVNFREQNIPGGWDDDWTGEFQLLNSNWYNASQYYVRTNVTYESPLMLFSRIPYAGRLMEMERIYVSTLFVEHLTPYVEYGYGFTNRFFSMGIFAATRNLKFDGFGCRFSFELFRDW